MKKWICAVLVSLLSCAPALADLPMPPDWPEPTEAPEGMAALVGGHLSVLLVALALVSGSIVLWIAVRARRAK